MSKILNSLAFAFCPFCYSQDCLSWSCIWASATALHFRSKTEPRENPSADWSNKTCRIWLTLLTTAEYLHSSNPGSVVQNPKPTLQIPKPDLVVLSCLWATILLCLLRRLIHLNKTTSCVKIPCVIVVSVISLMRALLEPPWTPLAIQTLVSPDPQHPLHSRLMRQRRMLKPPVTTSHTSQRTL